MSNPRIDWSKAGRFLARVRASSDLDWDDVAAVAFVLFDADTPQNQVIFVVRRVMDEAIDWNKVFVKRTRIGTAAESIEAILIAAAAPRIAMFLRKQYDKLSATERGQLIAAALDRGADVLDFLFEVVEPDEAEAA